METDHAITATPPSSTTLTGGHTKGLDPGIIALCSLVVVGLFALLTWLFGSGVCRKPIKQCVNKYCPGCLKTADVENPQSSSSQQQNRDSSECERLEVHGQTLQESAEDLVPGTGSPNDETNRSTLLNQTRSSDRHTERSEISEGNHSIETTTTTTTPVVNAEIHDQTLQGSAEDPVPGTGSPNDETDRSTLLNQTRSSDSLTERSELIEDCGRRPLTEAEHQREDMAMANDKMKDIYLVSSSDETPHVKKMKDMFQRNGWTFTSKVDGPLGEPVMNSAEEAVCTHKHIVVLFDEGDCTKKFGEYNMTMEMAFLSLGENEIGRKIIPIRCCDEKLVPLRLRCLRGRAINDDDLEKKMIQAIGKGIKIKREAQLSSVSGEQTLTSGTDEMDVSNGRFSLLGNILTNEYFMDLAQEIGTEWKDLAIRLGFSKAEIERIIERERDIKYRTLEILQCWHQRTSNIDMGRKVEILCKALMKCGREDLSDKVKADAERCS